MRSNSLIGLVCLSFLLLSTATAAPPTLDSEQWAFLSLINNFRAQNGAGPLQVSVLLQTSSQWMSNDLATQNPFFSHTDSLGRSPGARLAAFGYNHLPWGENIAAGYSDAQNTFNQWLTACDADASGQCTYAHRQNMLYGGFVAIGIGRAFSSSSPYGWYWTTDFGGFLDQAITPNPGSGPAPSITLFRATPSAIAAGQSAALTWSVTGATAISIDNGIGDVTNLASRSVSPGQTTTYTLTASNAGGSSTASTTITVTAPAPAACPAPASEAFTGCYYNNLTLSGIPALARTDTQINLDGSADPSVSPSGFSVRWQGSFNFAQGDYVFSAITADGMRLYIDGGLVLNAWRDQSATSYTVAQTLSQGQHLLTVEYYQRNGVTSAHLSWQKNDVRNGRGQPPPPAGDSQPPTAPALTSAVAKSSTEVDLAWTASTDNTGVAGYQIFRNGSVVATVTALGLADTGVAANTIYTYFVKAVDGAGNLSPASNSVQVATPGSPPSTTCGAPAVGAFTGCYYNNATLAGNPVLTRIDSLINFDWGTRAPDRSVSSTSYSVRWQGSFNFNQGDYAFTAITSDGMRVYIDGGLVLDTWRDQPATGYTFTRTLSQGSHVLTVEYYRQSGSASAHLSWQPVQPGGRR